MSDMVRRGHSLTVDEVFEDIGTFGVSQKVYFALLCLVHWWCAFHQLLTVFVGTVFWC